MTPDDYANVSDPVKARVESAFLASEGGDLIADILDGKFGREWQGRLERFIDERLATAGAEAA